MRVIWEKNGSRLYLGDCREVLPTLEKVDHVIGDPPYDARTHERARSLKNGGSDIPIDFEPLTSFDFVPELLALARRWVIAFCALEQFGEYQRASGDAWIRSAVWSRPDGTPQISGDRPAQAAEGIAIMHPVGRKRWNGGGSRGLWTCGVEREDRSGHPTQKPIALMMELVSLFTDEGETVLDPFAGSGTTGVACLRLGRKFVGVERDEKYAAIAAERLEAESQGLSLRDARAGQLPMFGSGS